MEFRQQIYDKGLRGYIADIADKSLEQYVYLYNKLYGQEVDEKNTSNVISEEEIIMNDIYCHLRTLEFYEERGRKFLPDKLNLAIFGTLAPAFCKLAMLELMRRRNMINYELKGGWEKELMKFDCNNHAFLLLKRDYPEIIEDLKQDDFDETDQNHIFGFLMICLIEDVMKQFSYK